MFVPTRAMLQQCAKAAGGGAADHAADLGSASIFLIKAPYSFTVDSVLADPALEEADYSGYARTALGAPSTPHIGQNGKSLVAFPSHVFGPSDTITLNSIYGYGLTGSSSLGMLGGELFDQPITQPNNLAAFVLQINVGFDPLANYGLASVSN